MRKLLVMLLTSVATFGLLDSAGRAQPQTKKPDDPAKVLENALKNLKQKDNLDLRTQAAMDLADFGPKAEPALPDLLDALQTKNEDLRLNAAIALSKIGKSAVAPVGKLLENEDLDTRFYAVWTIGQIGPDARETLPTIIKLMNDKNEGIRRKAAFALGRLAGDPGSTMTVLVKAFADEHDDVRQAAGDALAKFGKAAIPPLLDLLKGENTKARLQAATSLGEIGSDAKDAVPLLKERFLANPGDNVHHYANVLAKIGRPAVPALEAGFKDSRPEVRQAAGQALAQVGADAVGVLVDALGDKNVEVRRLAAQTLWPMRIGDKSVVIALAFALADNDDLVRQHSMNALANLGPQAKLGAAKIKEALVDMNPNVRQQAYFLLQQIGEDPRPALKLALASQNDKVRINTAALMANVGLDIKDATPVLLDALKHDDLGLRMQAASTLAQRNLHSDRTGPIFIDGLKHKSPGVRVQACQGLAMLGNFGKTDPASLNALTGALKDSESVVRQQALYALQNQRGDISAILPSLVELTKDKDISIRQQIIWMFSRAGANGAPHLANLLKDSDASIRIQAMQTLRNMGKNAEKALPAIKEAVKDENGNVRLNAMLILTTIGGEGPQYLAKQFEVEKDASTRIQLLQNLAFSGQAKFAAPLLVTAIKDPSVEVRQGVVNLLGYFGQDSKEGFEVFSLALKDKDNSVRTQAAYHAGNYPKMAWEPLVVELRATKDTGFRQALLQGMLRCQGRSKSGVEPLIDCLRDDNATVKQWACIVLAQIGPDAADALPRLRELANDSTNQAIQSQARAAVNAIERKK